jgi:hypothetical protein
VLQAFLTTFLIDSGYKTPIKNMHELFDSDLKLPIIPETAENMEFVYEIEPSILKGRYVNCQKYNICLDWAAHQKNMSIIFIDTFAEVNYALGNFTGENSEPLLCKLEDGELFALGQSMLMFHGDPLMKRVTEIIDRVLAAGLYNYWISLHMHRIKLLSRKIAIVHPLDGYYSFNLYHMQPAFYLLLMGWCLSALCFMVELLFNSFLRKRY